MPLPNENEIRDLMLAASVYRAGGQLTFTAEEIDEIVKLVGGVKLFRTPDNTMVLRVTVRDGEKGVA